MTCISISSFFLKVVFTNPSPELYDSIMGDSKKEVIPNAMQVGTSFVFVLILKCHFFPLTISGASQCVF